MQKLSLVSNKLLFWFSLWLFAFIPLYPKFPLFNVPGTYVAIRFEDLFIAVALLMLILAKFSKAKQIFNKTISQSILLYWAIGALALYSGIMLTQTVTLHLGVFHFLRRIEAMGLFFLTWQAFNNFHQIKLWMKLMFIVTMAIVIYGFGQQWLSFPVISTTNKEFSKGLILFLTSDARVNSTFAGHYDLAVYLMAFLCICAALFLYYRKVQTKIIIAIGSCFSFILISMNAARISFFAAVVGITLVLWFSNRRKLILILIVLVLLAFAVFPELRHRTVATLTVNLLEGGGPKYTPSEEALKSEKYFSIESASPSATTSGVPVDVAPGEPLNSTELGVYRSFGIRLNEEWPRALRAFNKNPVLGTGYSSISIATDNDYLRILGETGMLGFTSLALVWWIVLKKMWLFLKEKSRDFSYYLVLGVFTAMFAIFINATVIDVFESSKVAEILWMLLGLIFALIEINGSEIRKLGSR